LRSNIDAFEELDAAFPKAELEEYRKVIKESMDILNTIYDYTNKDVVVDPVELERNVAHVETLLIGAKRRIREATTAIEEQRERNYMDGPHK